MSGLPPSKQCKLLDVVTGNDVVALLHDLVPEADGLVAEHLADNDELLLHLLMSDLQRRAVAAYEAGETDTTDRVLTFADRCLGDGDDYVQNAVRVSFVEHFGTSPGETDDLLARWPVSLREALGR